MYLAVVLTTMLLAPLASIIASVASAGVGDLPTIAARWIVFWAVGIRLFLAGFNQILRPGFTARSIFDIGDPKASRLVSEIGFANVALGSIAVASLFRSGWLAPAGMAGAIYFGLAGILHVRSSGRNTKETVAMASDLMGAAVVAVALLASNGR